MSAFVAWPSKFGLENSRFLRSLIATLFYGLVTVASGADEPNSLKVPARGDWKIEIVPGPVIGPSPVPKAIRALRQAQAVRPDEFVEKLPPLPAREPAAEVVQADAGAAMPAGINRASYSEVYNSIPFRRSEYLANPSYRHDATIELMLGQIRPKAVTNVSAPAATCCSPQSASLVGVFNPWGAKNFYYHYSYSRPSSYWVW